MEIFNQLLVRFPKWIVSWSLLVIDVAIGYYVINNIIIDNPPPFGIGILCELRSFGISYRLFFIEKLRIKYVITVDIIKVIKKNNIKLNKLIFNLKHSLLFYITQ